jgi:hypothetical protein
MKKQYGYAIEETSSKDRDFQTNLTIQKSWEISFSDSVNDLFPHQEYANDYRSDVFTCGITDPNIHSEDPTVSVSFYTSDCWKNRIFQAF